LGFNFAAFSILWHENRPGIRHISGNVV